MPSASAGPGAAFGANARRGRPWSLKVYLVGLTVLFVMAAGANVVYQRNAAAHDARNAAAADAAFGASIAARDITAALDLVRTTGASTAANPGIRSAFGGEATGCTLTFAGAGEFDSGHLDIVAADGTVACSSLAATPGPGYADASWLAGALAAPTLVGPVRDARTGEQVMVATSPVASEGVVVAFLDLDALGVGLASRLGGPSNLEFVVTSSDDTVVISRSIDPARWVGSSPARTPFAGANGQVEHRDLDGTARLYGQASVDPLGWKVFAGADKANALVAANGLSNRQLANTVAGLAVFLAAAVVVYRRIAKPIAKLSAGVRAASAHTPAEPLRVAGPAEVLTLVDDFNQLIAAASRELEATSRLAAIVESSSDAIFGKTMQGVITSWNAAAEHMFGYTADEIIGHNVAELIPPARAGELPPILEQVRRGERVEQFETERVHKDGRIIDAAVIISPICDANGTVIGASALSRDMTDVKRAAAERQAFADRLHQSQRLESLGQLAGGIAHDFNNLLAVIMNYATFVAKETADQPAVRGDVQQIQLAAERAARLTKQLLIFGRRETIQPETLDLNAIVEDIQNLLSRSIGEHIDLTIHPAADLPAICADRGQIEQVLVNLAVNARDAMPRGGTLTVETSPAELDEGYTKLHPDIAPGHYVQLAVSDTGIGMSGEVAGRIFEPFFTTKPAGEGTGLGLATVFGIVTAAGGAIRVYSEEGIGTTFRLYFPVSDTAARAIQPIPAAMPQGHGETVLVVEDAPAVLKLTARMLRANGYAVLEAATLAEALSQAAGHDFQLLLTDSVMPEMSGRGLAERIDELKPGRAVLYMSGYSPGVIGPQGILQPGVAHLQKPFNERTLLETVRSTLTERPAAAAGARRT